MYIDFKRLSLFCLPHLPQLVQEWAPGGFFEGDEYKTFNPTRNDKEIGSFKINIRTGEWADFAEKGNPDSKNNTVLSLYEYIHKYKGLKATEYAEELAKRVGYTENAPMPVVKSTPNKKDWEPIFPVPSYASKPPANFVKSDGNGGIISIPIQYFFPVVSITNELLGYITRYEIGKTKDTPPLTFCKNKNDNRTQWRFKGFPIPRPLMNQYELYTEKGKKGVLVEGEKKYKALKDFVAKHKMPFVISSWIGGCNNVNKANWNILEEFQEEIIIWPDNDLQKYKKEHPKAGQLIPKEEQTGYIAAVEIYAILKKLKKNVKIIDPPYTEKKDGWDCYDAIHEDKFTVEQLQEFISSRLFEPGNNSSTPAEQLYQPFKCLGHNKGFHFYFSHGSKQVIKIKGDSHTPGALLTLNPDKTYWMVKYPGKRDSVDWLSAQSDLIFQNYNKGIYDQKNKRGRGVWPDNGRYVIHLGDRLIVDDKECSIEKLESKYIYEAGPVIDEHKADPLVSDESRKLLQIAHMLEWENPLYPYFLSGFIALAPICGALNWRPNIWLTGASGTGKTFVMTNIIKPAIGPFSHFVSAGTSAAALRILLETDAMVIQYDESDADTDKSQISLDQIFEMSRASSSETGAKIYKATQMQTLNQFDIRSMFCFSSVGVSMEKTADLSRTQILTLTHPKKRKGSDLQFRETIKFINLTMNEEWCRALRWRSMKLIPVIRANSEIFKQVISEICRNTRYGDQTGALLAGAFSLQSEEMYTRESATELLSNFDFAGTSEPVVKTDEEVLLQSILQHIIRADNNKEYAIGEIVQRLLNPEGFDNFEKWSEDQKDLNNLLKRYGIRVDKRLEIKNEFALCIADSHTALKKILDKTAWSRTWGGILKRLPCSFTIKNMRFADGSSSRTTAIPCSLIFGDD